MADPESLLQLLLEELLETGASVEDVCRAHPELIPEVRRRLALVRGVQAQMDALFPPPPFNVTVCPAATLPPISSVAPAIVSLPELAVFWLVVRLPVMVTLPPFAAIVPLLVLMTLPLMVNPESPTGRSPEIGSVDAFGQRIWREKMACTALRLR